MRDVIRLVVFATIALAPRVTLASEPIAASNFVLGVSEPPKRGRPDWEVVAALTPLRATMSGGIKFISPGVETAPRIDFADEFNLTPAVGARVDFGFVSYTSDRVRLSVVASISRWKTHGPHTGAAPLDWNGAALPAGARMDWSHVEREWTAAATLWNYGVTLWFGFGEWRDEIDVSSAPGLASRSTTASVGGAWAGTVGGVTLSAALECTGLPMYGDDAAYLPDLLALIAPALTAINALAPAPGSPIRYDLTFSASLFDIVTLGYTLSAVNDSLGPGITGDRNDGYDAHGSFTIRNWVTRTVFATVAIPLDKYPARAERSMSSISAAQNAW